MSKPTRSKRRELRQKGVRALERASGAPPERAAEERARAQVLLAASKPRPSLPRPVIRSAARSDDDVASARDRDDEDSGPREAASVAKKPVVNRTPLVLAGLVALAFVILFAAQRGGLWSSSSSGEEKPAPASAPTAPTPHEEPKLPDDNSPPTIVTLPPPSTPPPASAAASATPSATPSAAVSAPASAAVSAAPSAAASARPKVSTAPATTKASTAAPKPAPVKKKAPVSSDPY